MEARRSSTGGAHTEVESSTVHHIGRSVLVIFFGGEVGLQDVDDLLVDLVIAVVLKGLDVVQTSALLDDVGILVNAIIVGVFLADLEQVLQALEGDQDNSSVTASQELAHGLDEVVVDHVTDLFAGATGSSVT